MGREIKIEYVCQHTYAGDTRIFRYILDLNSIEDTIDVIELICSEIDPCTCLLTEAQNHCDCDSILDHGEFEIIARRQYTGLKDKNGVEIYEGDVLKVTRSNPVWDEDIVDYSAVEYGNCEFFVDLADKKLRVSNNYWGTTMEVIGNIHQNPELLK